MFTIVVCLVVVGVACAAVIRMTFSDVDQPATTTRLRHREPSPEEPPEELPSGWLEPEGPVRDEANVDPSPGPGPTRLPVELKPLVTAAIRSADEVTVAAAATPAAAPVAHPRAEPSQPVVPMPEAVPSRAAKPAPQPTPRRSTTVLVERPGRWRRIRSSVALMAMLALVGVLVAVTIGVVLGLLALGLRSAVGA